MNYNQLKRPYFIVIDMVNGFVKEGPMSDKRIEKIIPNIQSILDATNANKVLFIADIHQRYDIEFQSFPEHCLQGTSEAEIIDELKPYVKRTVLEKNTTNGFHKFLTHGILAEVMDSYEIVLSGCCTDICVLQFALSLKTWLNAQGSITKVIVPKNCVETYDSKEHNAKEYNEFAYRLMKEAGIEVVDEMVFLETSR